MSEAREIARGLTRAQRRALRTGLARSLLVARAMVDWGLFRGFGRDAISRLVWLGDTTPLGLEVRAILEGERS